MSKIPSGTVVDALRALLQKGESNNQEMLCNQLEAQGFEVNQTKISRLLRKLGAAKAQGQDGSIGYRLPKEPGPASSHTTLTELVSNVVYNEQVIIVYTSPGSASMIARLMDYQDEKLGILGTVAGDDTILVIPRSVHEIKNVQLKIKEALGLR